MATAAGSDDQLERVAQAILDGAGADARALARGLTWIEARDGRGDALLERLRLASETRGAPGPGTVRIGVTGAPGVGKSSLVAALIPELRERGETVAVLAVDPTSPVSGGAVLADRVRMDRHGHSDAGVFIRSLASRSGRGGLALSTDEAADVLEFAGFGLVLIETVGVGQLELEIVDESDRVLLLLSPESGDTMQFLKGGMMEVVDDLVVNQKDRPGAERTLRFAEELARSRGLEAPLAVSATSGDGVSELADHLLAVTERCRARPQDERRRRRTLRRLVRRAEETWLASGWRRAGGMERAEQLAADVVAGRSDFRAALGALTGSFDPAGDGRGGEDEKRIES